MTYEQAGGGRAGLGITKADGEELSLMGSFNTPYNFRNFYRRNGFSKCW